MSLVKASVPWDWGTRQKHMVLHFPVSEYRDRIAKVRREMEERGLTHLIAYSNFADPADVRWLSGFNTSHGDSFVVIAPDREPALVTNWIMHDEPMHSEIWTSWMEDTRACPPFSNSLIDEVAAAAKADGDPRPGRIGLSGQRVMPARILTPLLQACGLESFANGDAVTAAARRIKSPLEIEMVRRASRAAGAGIGAALAALEPGVTEQAATSIAHGTMFAAGAEQLAFESSFSSGGARAGMKHCTPSWKPFEAGDAVFIDMGAIVHGYYSDVSRCAAVGEPSPELRRLLAAGEVLFEELVKLAKPGRSFADLHEDAIRIARDLGYEKYYMPGGFGHGVGCMLFERPSLRYRETTDILEVGMTFAFEPMFVQYGVGTAVVEDTMLVTEKGIEPLSGLPTKVYAG